jgi:hypothetical protein
MNIVLYAEGISERGGSITLLPPVGDPLPEETLGAAHLLIRRLLTFAMSVSAADVVFCSPMRVPPGRHARGSDLVNPTAVRRLLSWPKREQIPHLAIVLVDADGDGQRATRLRAALAQVDVTFVVAVAVQEFEAWLIADHECLAELLGAAAALSGATENPESLQPRAAKELVMRWTTNEDLAELRRKFAIECDLQRIIDRCSSLANLVRELRQVPPA